LTEKKFLFFFLKSTIHFKKQKKILFLRLNNFPHKESYNILTMSKVATQNKQSSQKDLGKQQVADKYADISDGDLIEDEQTPAQTVGKQQAKQPTKAGSRQKKPAQKGRKNTLTAEDEDVIDGVEDDDDKRKKGKGKVTLAQLAKQGGARMGPTFYGLYKQYQGLIKQQRELSRKSNLLVKGLVELHVIDYKKVKKEEKKNVSRTGFKKSYQVPQPLSDFLGVQANAEYTAPRIAAMVWTTMKNKQLTKGHSFIVNDEVAKIFGVSLDANNYKADDPRGFHFFNLNSILRTIIIDKNSPKVTV
jgi:hypothetical protein